MNRKIKSFLLVLQTQLSNNKNLKGVNNLQRRLWCSVCANRGHLAETCQRQFNLKFPPNQMKITSYQNLYKPDQKQSTSKNNDESLNYWDIHNITFDSKNGSFFENHSNGSVNEILKCVDVAENQIKTMEITYRNQTFESNITNINESSSSDRIVALRTLESSRSTSRSSTNNENQTREFNENLDESEPVIELDPFTSTIYLTIRDLERLENFNIEGKFQNWIEKGVSFLINDTLSVPTLTIKGALMHKKSVTAAVLESLYNKHSKYIKIIKNDLRLIFNRNPKKVRIEKLYSTISSKNLGTDNHNLKLLNSYLFGNLNYEGRCTKEIEILKTFYDEKYPELTPEVTMAHRRVFLYYHGDYEEIIAKLNESSNIAQIKKPIANQSELASQKELAIKLVNELIAVCTDFNRKTHLKLLRKQLDNPNNPNATTVSQKNSTALRLVAKRMKYSGDISFLNTRKNKGRYNIVKSKK